MTKAILIVEDAPDLRMLYKFAFREKPFAVHIAADGEQALQILGQQADISVVLLDLTLPGISGEEVLKQSRANPEWADIKFIVMSGWDDLKQRSNEMGADGFIRKPITIPDLEARVDALLFL